MPNPMMPGAGVAAAANRNTKHCDTKHCDTTDSGRSHDHLRPLRFGHGR
jgi:hypothetical protein